MKCLDLVKIVLLALALSRVKALPELYLALDSVTGSGYAF